MNSYISAGCVIFCIFLAVSGCGNKSDNQKIYGQKELQTASNTYHKNLKHIWSDDFLSRLTISERRIAGDVQIDFPLVGVNSHPLDFYADPHLKVVTIPIQSVKFLDDLFTAYAYLDFFNCRNDALFDYVAILTRRTDYPPVSPFQALNIPATALENEYVNKTSGNALKSAIYFVLAHEYAHVMYQHKNYREISANQAQEQEIEADNFALKIMNRIGVAPLGMVQYFSFISLHDRVPSDFNREHEYDQYIKDTATHPMSSKRLINISNKIKADPGGYVRSEYNPNQWISEIISAANDIELIGKYLEDVKLRERQIHRIMKLSSTELAKACRQQ